MEKREASVIVGEGSRTRGEGGCEWAQPVGAPAEPVESGEVRVRRRCEAVRSESEEGVSECRSEAQCDRAGRNK